MTDQQPPEEPFDPYRPPPPGQQPPPQYGGQQYGGQPPSPGGPPQPYGRQQYGGQQYDGQQYGGQPQHGEQQYGAQGVWGYGQPYLAPPKRSAKPLWFGALIGLVLVVAAVWLGVAVPDLGPWVLLALAVAVVVLLVVPVTRRWGVGILIGALLSVPIGLIIFAGICVVLIAGYSGGGA